MAQIAGRRFLSLGLVTKARAFAPSGVETITILTGHGAAHAICFDITSFFGNP